MADCRDQVLFEKIAKSYPTGAHIECSYTMKPSHKPTTYDWIGLYKVGWANAKEFIFYHWVPFPKDKPEDGEHRSSILFQSGTLPKDDGEFYQFVYFNDKSKMCGASSPFIFQTPRNDDFVEEVMADDEDMLYITTKGGQLEVVKKECERLSKTCDAMNVEINNLSDQLKDAEKRLADAEAEKAELSAQLQENAEGLDARLETAEKSCAEKEEINARLTVELHKLAEEVEQRRTEVNLLREQLDTTTKDATEQIGNLQKKVDEGLPDKEALDTLQAQLSASREKVADLKKTKQQLKEQKHDLEDKLEAAEARHVVDTTEINTLNETLVCLSSKVEEVNTANEDMRNKFARERKDWENTLDQMGKEKNSLLSTIGELKHKLDQMAKEDSVSASNYENQEDRYFALQTAYGLLREELREQSRKNVEIQKREQTHRMRTEIKIQDLQGKIKEGHEEYTKLASQKSKLERRLNRKPASVDPALLKRSMSQSSRDELTREELLKMVEQLSEELEARTQKKDRYKDKYLDEKQRAATLRDYYKGEMNKLNAELTTARKLSPPVRANPPPIVYPPTPLVEEREVEPPVVPFAAAEVIPVIPPLQKLSTSTAKPKGAMEPHILEDNATRELLLPAPMEPIKTFPGLKPDGLSPQATSNPQHNSILYPSAQIYPPAKKNLTEEVRMPPEQSDSDEDNEGADRFHDASDVPASIDKCFICHKTFSDTDSEEMRNAHACEHLDATRVKAEDALSDYYQCPMCREKFLKKELSEEDMHAHVNAHFMMPM